MSNYTFVDSDAHVEECNDTWAYLPPEFQSRRPVCVTLPKEQVPSRGLLNAYWMIDGKVLPQLHGKGSSFFIPADSELGQKKSFSQASQEISDVKARLADMDRMEIDIQVLFPTIFIFNTTDDLEFEAALHRSYNTWLAKACSQAPDRLKWNAIIPVRHPEAAVQEIKRVKELGAVGAVTYGTAGEKFLHNPGLDPVYATLTELDMPLCLHFGGSFPGLRDACYEAFSAVVLSNTMPVFPAFFSMTGGGVLDRFPDLRVGFFEWGSEWIPYAMDRFDQYYTVFQRLGFGELSRKSPSEYVRDGNLYVTCESEDRLLPYIIEMWGEDRILLSSDIPHVELRDNAKEELLHREDVSPQVKQKILVDNTLRFYGLE
ncbi:MAG TPA: amidohydrolase family protein [Dehalococcoidia bacterium]|nr:amidohydrolase family protein [Dehalococcoidia bacterium]